MFTLTYAAVTFSIVSLSLRNPSSDLIAAIVGAIFSAMMVCLGLAAYFEWRVVKKAHEDDANRLLALEEHRSRSKSLPDITLAEIVKSEPDKLKKRLKAEAEKLLKESEPSAAAPPDI